MSREKCSYRSTRAGIVQQKSQTSDPHMVGKSMHADFWQLEHHVAGELILPITTELLESKTARRCTTTLPISRRADEDLRFSQSPVPSLTIAAASPATGICMRSMSLHVSAWPLLPTWMPPDMAIHEAAVPWRVRGPRPRPCQAGPCRALAMSAMTRARGVVVVQSEPRGCAPYGCTRTSSPRKTSS